jgi:hypothetical protein
MSAALAVLACRLGEPRVSGDAVWLPCSGNTGPARLPLAFTPGIHSEETEFNQIITDA